jgi:hypothetical protein
MRRGAMQIERAIGRISEFWQTNQDRKGTDETSNHANRWNDSFAGFHLLRLA